MLSSGGVPCSGTQAAGTDTGWNCHVPLRQSSCRHGFSGDATIPSSGEKSREKDTEATLVPAMNVTLIATIFPQYAMRFISPCPFPAKQTQFEIDDMLHGLSCKSPKANLVTKR
jgi:hypothetical protein